MRKSNWKVNVNGQGLAVNEIMSKFWLSRKVDNPTEFMDPSEIHLVPYHAFMNIEDAARIVTTGIAQKANFLIYADTDADGCTSCAILYHYLKKFNCNVSTFINDNKDHGIQDYFELPEETDIVIVVDSINDNMEMYNKILNNNVALVVLDHHIPEPCILAEQHRINLVSSANNYPNPHLSGSGVTWRFTRYLDELLDTRYSDEFVDLAATGIIADVCSVGAESMENRAICNLGFKYVNNPGIKAILGTNDLDSNQVGFSIAPLVNAANRMNENKLALSLFLCETEKEAKEIVKQLTKIKDTQKKKVAELFDKMIPEVEPQQHNSCYYFFVGEDCKNLGGLLATKLSSKYHRPCLVLHTRDDDYAGSMRAEGVGDFSKIVNESGLGECKGHENSAGITIPKQNLESLKTYIEGALKDIHIQEDTVVDIQLERMQITPFLLLKFKDVNRIAGPGFPPVTVLIENIKKYEVKPLSQGKHLCIAVPDMKFIQWNFNNWDDVEKDGVLSCIGTLEESFFMGKRTNQMLMEDYVFQPAPKIVGLW